MTHKPTMRATMTAAQRNLKPPSPSVDPAVRRLGDILQHNAGFVHEIARKAGVGVNCLRRYRRGLRDPSVSVLRALLNATGYDLAVVRKKEFDE